MESERINRDNKEIHIKPRHKVKTTLKIIRGIDLEGRSTVNQYSFVKKLGEGTFAKVKLAVKGEKDEKYAIKIISKYALKKRRELVKGKDGKVKLKDPMQDINREIAIMKKLDHPNIIKLFEVLDQSDSDKLFLVIEYAAGGQYLEWNDMTQEFYRTKGDNKFADEQTLRKIFRDCIRGLDYRNDKCAQVQVKQFVLVHFNDVVHRDIKPQNILCDDKGNFKLSDFGVAVILDKEDLFYNNQGTYQFYPPEACKKDFEAYSGKMADIWALGVSFYGFVYHAVPYHHENPRELLKLIESEPVPYPSTRKVTDGLLDLLQRMLEKDPTKRIQMEQLKNHPWLTEGYNALQTERDSKDSSKKTAYTERYRASTTLYSDIRERLSRLNKKME